MDDAPIITLGGQQWSVPQLPLSNSSKVIPIIQGLVSLDITKLTEDDINSLGKVAYYGIKRGSPDLTLDAFLEMPVTLEELILALPTISHQAGLRKAGAPGEAQGGNPSTSTN
jgi:hypothetical protein